MMRRAGWPVLAIGLLVTSVAACGIMQPPATGAPRSAQSMPQPSPTGATGQATQPTPTSLSFDVLGQRKAYTDVTAAVGSDALGQPITLILAKDGTNAMALTVTGTGVGTHPVTQVAIKDALLGDQPRVFGSEQVKMAGTVTFTTFEPIGGRIVGTLDARYQGFPPVAISNGQLTATHASLPALPPVALVDPRAQEAARTQGLTL